MDLDKVVARVLRGLKSISKTLCPHPESSTGPKGGRTKHPVLLTEIV
jgi:hypothetical protein